MYVNFIYIFRLVSKVLVPTFDYRLKKENKIKIKVKGSF